MDSADAGASAETCFRVLTINKIRPLWRFPDANRLVSNVSKSRGVEVFGSLPKESGNKRVRCDEA